MKIGRRDMSIYDSTCARRIDGKKMRGKKKDTKTNSWDK